MHRFSVKWFDKSPIRDLKKLIVLGQTEFSCDELLRYMFIVIFQYKILERHWNVINLIDVNVRCHGLPSKWKIFPMRRYE